MANVPSTPDAIERPGVTRASLRERAAVTAVVPLLALVANAVPLPYVDAPGHSWGHPGISLLAVGPWPFLKAYWVIEVAALIFPPWRRSRGDSLQRQRLTRAASVLGVVLTAVTAYAHSEDLESSGLQAVADWGPHLMQIATMVGGSCAMALAVRWATQRGFVSGYILWWATTVMVQLWHDDPFREATVRGGRAGALVLTLALLVQVAGTVLVTLDRGAYRTPAEASPSTPVRPNLVPPLFPAPVGSVAPLFIAFSALAVPRLLAGHRVSGMAGLDQALHRSVLGFDLSFVVLLVFGVVLANAISYRRSEVVAGLRAFQGGSELEARAEVKRAFLGALPPTLAYLGAVILGAGAANGRASAAPTVIGLAITTAGLTDLVRSLWDHARAPDLVCVGELYDPWMVAVVCSRLETEGIEVRPRGMATFSLLQVFAPFAPLHLEVRATDGMRAVELLDRWASRGAPRADDAAAPAPLRIRRSPGTSTLEMAGLGGVAVLLLLTPQGVDVAMADRSEITLVKVDDLSDPLKGVTEEDVPAGVSIYVQTVPVGGGLRKSRSFARVYPREGESAQAAWLRISPWLRSLPLAEGRRWAFESAMEPDDDNERTPRSFHEAGVRTVLLEGQPVVMKADVEDAQVIVQDHGRPAVVVALRPSSAERFAQFTQQWVGRRIAVVENDHVDTVPTIREPIRGGRLTLTMGVGTEERQVADARRIAASLRP